MDGTGEHHLKWSYSAQRPKIPSSPSYVNYRP
jgi:hypothetical protein